MNINQKQFLEEIQIFKSTHLLTYVAILDLLEQAIKLRESRRKGAKIMLDAYTSEKRKEAWKKRKAKI